MKSSFTFHNLSDTDKLNGAILTDLQKRVIDNEVATIAEQILLLKYDPNNQLRFVQDDSFLKGQLQAYQYLLLRSDDSQQALLKIAQQSQS